MSRPDPSAHDPGAGEATTLGHGVPSAPPPPPPRRRETASRAGQAGRLTPGWRFTMAVTWVGVMAAWAGIWNASVQIGLSTWWLGPRGDPQPTLVRLVPFLVAGTVVVVALNRIRATPWIGLAAAAVLGAIAIGDVGRVDRLALVEGAVALAAGLVSVVALTGRYRTAG